MKKILMPMIAIFFVAGVFLSSAHAVPMAALGGNLYVYGETVPMADIEDFLEVADPDLLLDAKVEGGSDSPGEGIGTVSPPNSDFALTVSGTTFEDSDAVSGTWTASAAVSAYVLKAGNYSLLAIIDPAFSGTWSLNPLYAWFNENIITLDTKGDWTPALSHFEAFSTSAPVPEPATMLLLGTGLLGLAGVSRKKLSKNK